MSVIVKGMKMPDNCSRCDMMVGTFCQILNIDVDPFYDGATSRNKKCPLVELPERHGRLIDADELFEELRCANWEVSYFFDGTFLNISEFANIIQNIVTVIEAEDGT